MENYVRFGYFGRGRGRDEPDYGMLLPVIWAVLREFPEARRAVEAAVVRWREGGKE